MTKMQLSCILTAAGLAVSTANAFLLPFPEPSENDMVNTLPVPIETDFKIPTIANTQKLELSCPGCPVRVRHHKNKPDSIRIKTDIPSHLNLEFSIFHGPDHDRLIVNGFELYPDSDPIHNTLRATLVPDRHNGKHQNEQHKKKENKDKTSIQPYLTMYCSKKSS